MKINKNMCLPYDKIPNTQFHRLSKKMENDLNNWCYTNKKTSGHDVVEKVLSVVGNYAFNKRYTLMLNDQSFRLLTTDNEYIDITFYYGDFDNLEMLKIKKENIEEWYEVFYRDYKEELIVKPWKTKELENGFEQYYSTNADSFLKLNGTKTIEIIIRNDKTESEEFYFIDENVKQLFKTEQLSNAMDAYNFVLKNIPSLSFEIYVYDKESKIEEKIKVKNGEIVLLKLLREVNGNIYTVEEKFENEYDESVLEELLEEVQNIHKENTEMVRKLSM